MGVKKFTFAISSPDEFLLFFVLSLTFLLRFRGVDPRSNHQDGYSSALRVCYAFLYGILSRVRTIVTIGLSLRLILALSDDYRSR